MNTRKVDIVEELCNEILAENDPHEVRGLMLMMLHFYNLEELKKIAANAVKLPHNRFRDESAGQ